jgi:signal transduction histidine kinase
VDVASDITIESHLPMLRSIVSNLVSNAIEYAPKGSTIRVACRTEGGRISFSTANPAPDLTRDDVGHLFEPFWRKDSVRTTGSHAGLGLTLTQSLAKALNLAVRAELGSDGHLAIILVSLPSQLHTA